MAASKVVPATSSMQWDQRGPTQVLWQAPVEIDAVQSGQLTLYVNPLFQRRWTFKLALHRTEVYRVDVKEPPVSHSNPPGRPDDCPGKVVACEHEHHWIEGLDLYCAYPIEGMTSAGHERILEEFCERANIDFRPQYAEPAVGFQLEI